MKRLIKKLLTEALNYRQNLERFYSENPELKNELKLHCLDVRIETLEELLNNKSLAALKRASKHNK